MVDDPLEPARGANRWYEYGAIPSDSQLAHDLVLALRHLIDLIERGDATGVRYGAELAGRSILYGDITALHREGWTGPKIKGGNSGAPFAWFVFSPQAHPPETGYVTKRISWRVDVPTDEVDLFSGVAGLL